MSWSGTWFGPFNGVWFGASTDEDPAESEPLCVSLGSLTVQPLFSATLTAEPVFSGTVEVGGCKED